MPRLLRVAILSACLLCARAAFGGSCPMTAQYYALSDPGSASMPTLVTLASLGVTNCYYIAANGSDSNDGASEASPWAHVPGMATCTGNCASLTPAAGTGFIIRGGDTWNNTNFRMWSHWSGTATNPIYIGVDQSWYSGSSWARPIFSAGLTTYSNWGNTTSVYLVQTGAYSILDNIEFTGLYETSSVTAGAYICAGGGGNGSYAMVENTYLHGWGHDSTFVTGNSGIQGMTWCGSNKIGGVARYNVVDGSDTDQYQVQGALGHGGTPPTAYGNVMRYVETAMSGTGDNWHDNLFEYLASCGGGGCGHQDQLYHMCGTGYTTTILIYNNVIRHTTWPSSGGAVKLWLSGNCASPGQTGYVFNNILYDNYPGNMVDTGGHNSNISYGTWYFFNNTIDCGTDSVMGACGVGMNTGATLNMYLSNNHWIQNTTASPLSCTNDPGGTCSHTNDLMQTLAQANAQGYTDTSAYAFQPTSASGSTVTAAASAASVQSPCSTISAVYAGAGAACQSDTSYACTYSTTNNMVLCPARQTIARGTQPNIGAYQFGSAHASTPNPPTDLTVSVE